jgi:hypothetical protein
VTNKVGQFSERANVCPASDLDVAPDGLLGDWRHASKVLRGSIRHMYATAWGLE